MNLEVGNPNVEVIDILKRDVAIYFEGARLRFMDNTFWWEKSLILELSRCKLEFQIVKMRAESFWACPHCRTLNILFPSINYKDKNKIRISDKDMFKLRMFW